MRALLLMALTLWGVTAHAQPTQTTQLPATQKRLANALQDPTTRIYGSNLMIDNKHRVIGIAQPDGNGGALVSPLDTPKRPKLDCAATNTCGASLTNLEDWRAKTNTSKFDFPDYTAKAKDDQPKPTCVWSSCEYVPCTDWHDKGKVCVKSCIRTCK